MENYDFLETFIKKTDPNLLWDNCGCAFSKCVESENLRAVELFLQCGTDPNRDNDGDHPFIWHAIFNNQKSMVELLFNCGLNPKMHVHEICKGLLLTGLLFGGLERKLKIFLSSKEVYLCFRINGTYSLFLEFIKNELNVIDCEKKEQMIEVLEHPFMDLLRRTFNDCYYAKEYKLFAKNEDADNLNFSSENKFRRTRKTSIAGKINS